MTPSREDFSAAARPDPAAPAGQGPTRDQTPPLEVDLTDQALAQILLGGGPAEPGATRQRGTDGVRPVGRHAAGTRTTADRTGSPRTGTPRPGGSRTAGPRPVSQPIPLV